MLRRWWMAPQLHNQPSRGSELTVGKAIQQPIQLLVTSVGWACAQLAWNEFYSSHPALARHYPEIDTFFQDIAFFWVSIRHKSLVVRFKGNSKVFLLCVSPCHLQGQAVTQRLGFHASNGHQALFCFGEGQGFHVACCDVACKAKFVSVRGHTVCNLPVDICVQADAAFRTS
jgi:hypothetical protein